MPSSLPGARVTSGSRTHRRGEYAGRLLLRQTVGMDAQTWDERYAASDLVWSAEPNRFVEELLGDRPPGRVVDIAAGEGRNALWLAGRGWDALAVDYSRVGIERARQRAAALPEGARFEARVGDATDPVPDPPYDLALLCYLQIPREEYVVVLGHAVDALKPGGRLFVVGHALQNLEHGHGGPSDPAVLYDPEEIVARLDGLPLEVEHAEIRERPVADAPRPALDTVVEATRVP